MNAPDLTPAPLRVLFDDLPRCFGQGRVADNKRNQVSDKRTLHTLIILCTVDQAECIRQGIDAPSSTVKIEVDPKALTEEQRNFVADHVYDGLRFPKNSRENGNICPPTHEGFIAAVNYGVAMSKHPFPNGEERKELNAIRRSLISAAIAEMRKRKETGKSDIPF